MPRKRTREEKQDASHLRSEPIESDSHYHSKVFDHNLFQRKEDTESESSLMYRSCLDLLPLDQSSLRTSRKSLIIKKKSQDRVIDCCVCKEPIRSNNFVTCLIEGCGASMHTDCTTIGLKRLTDEFPDHVPFCPQCSENQREIRQSILQVVEPESLVENISKNSHFRIRGRIQFSPGTSDEVIQEIATALLTFTGKQSNEQYTRAVELLSKHTMRAQDLNQGPT